MSTWIYKKRWGFWRCFTALLELCVVQVAKPAQRGGRGPLCQSAGPDRWPSAGGAAQCGDALFLRARSFAPLRLRVRLFFVQALVIRLELCHAKAQRHEGSLVRAVVCSIPARLGSGGRSDVNASVRRVLRKGGARGGIAGRRKRWGGFCQDGAWALDWPLQTSEWRRERGHCARLTLRHS